MVDHDVKAKPFQPFLDFFFLSVLAFFLFALPWSYGLTRFQRQLWTELILFALFLIYTPFLNLQKIFTFNIQRMDFWILLILLLGFLYVPASVLPYESLLAFFQLLSCVVLYWLMRNLVTSRKRFQLFLWLFLLTGVFYAAYGLLQYYGYFSKAFWYQERSLASRFINGSHFGGFLFFSLFIGLSQLVSSRRIFIPMLLIPALLILGWALLLTHARAEWIAFLVGLMFFIFFTLGNKTDRKKGLWGMIFFLFLGGVLLVSKGGLSQISERFHELLTGHKAYSLIFRWNVWVGSLQAIQERPWGWGLGTFSSVFPQFRIHADRYFIDYAHNDLAQIGVNLGLPGLASLAGFLFFYFWNIFKILKNNQADFSKKMITGGFGAVVLSFFLAGQMDFPLWIYAIGLSFAAFLALSAYHFEMPEQHKKEVLPAKHQPGIHVSENFVRSILCLTFLLMIVLTARQLFAQIHFEKGERLEKAFSWVEAEEAYAKAIQLAPLYHPYHAALGGLLQKKAALSFSSEQRERALTASRKAYQKASSLQPFAAPYHFLLAKSYGVKSEIEQAKQEFKKAVLLEPQNALFVSEFAVVAAQNAMLEETLWALERLKDIPFQEHLPISIYACQTIKTAHGMTKRYEQLLRITPDSWQGHYCLGASLAEDGRWDLARKEFDIATQQAKKELGEKPYFANLGRSIAGIYVKSNFLQEALKIYQEALAIHPENDHARLSIQEITQKLSAVKPAGPSS